MQRAKRGVQDQSGSDVAFLVECMRSHEVWRGIELSLVAATSLARLGVQGVVQAAGGLATDPSPTAQIAYAYALGKTRDPLAVGHLDSMLKAATEDVALWVCLALAETGSGAVRVLEESFQEASTDPRRLLILDALNRMGPGTARQSLTRCLDALDRETRSRMLSELAIIETSRVL